MSKPLAISDKPTIIAGPCSVENPKQLQTIVEQLGNDSRISMIRIGVWKPRTRPGGFEGVGEPALQWVFALKKDFPKLHFCCEVARPEHIALCMQYNIDTVWIGARTSVNPFLVGELAEALRGTKISVMVKNPITPDISLWIGAIERLQQNSIHVVAAIHRGFTTYNNLNYRNNPLWEIPIELKRRMPEMPLLCDPSHIGGQRDLIAPISQMALDLHFDGLMVECHPEPYKALTDSQQQITPAELFHILDHLKIRQHDTVSPGALLRLREQLDLIDAEILRLLSERMKLSKEIGLIKQDHNMPIFQPQRWQQVLDQQIQMAKTMGLDESFVRELTDKIHSESLRMQE